MNTRDADIAKLETEGAQKTLKRVHALSKNPELERLRKLMIDAEKRGDRAKAAQIAAHIQSRRWA